MKQLKELKKNHVICFCMLAVVINEVLIRIPISILDYFGLSDRSTNSGYLLLELISLAGAVFMLYLTGQEHVLKYSYKDFAKSILSGMVFLILAITGCSVFAAEGTKAGVTYRSIPDIMAFVAFVITVGLAEEFLFRGIIADCILERFGSSKTGVFVSVILSGGIFGVMHLLNVFYGRQSLESSFIQMIAAGMLGILLSAIYIRHKSVYGVAFLHAVLNFMTMFTRGVWEGNTLLYQSEDINFGASLKQSLISQSIYIIVALFVLRPSVVRKIIEARSRKLV